MPVPATVVTEQSHLVGGHVDKVEKPVLIEPQVIRLFLPVDHRCESLRLQIELADPVIADFAGVEIAIRSGAQTVRIVHRAIRREIDDLAPARLRPGSQPGKRTAKGTARKTGHSSCYLKRVILAGNYVLLPQLLQRSGWPEWGWFVASTWYEPETNIEFITISATFERFGALRIGNEERTLC